MQQKPNAAAVIKGGPDHPGINGTVEFYHTKMGVLVSARVSGLPTGNNICEKPIFAFHIHSGGSCTGNTSDYFADVSSHYNPWSCPHPYHAGDMPPLFGVDGFAFLTFLTDRFSIEEIIGKTVIIHSGSDDFSTQPSGNYGSKIACGVINPA